MPRPGSLIVVVATATGLLAACGDGVEEGEPR